MKQERFLPEQEHGIKKDFERSMVLDTVEQAREVFRIVSERMRSINEWDKYTGLISAGFTLTDKEGKEIHRMAEPGDYVRINVPGPSLSADKYDWVHVHGMKDTADNLRDETVFSLELRPAPTPAGPGNEVTHFFSDSASSSFILMRQHKKLTLSYHGRNEVPNLGISSFRDKFRNLLLGIGAILGLSDMQWSKLLDGMLDPEG